MNHSIQEYYKRSHTTPADSTPPGDGFTSSEISAVLKPMSVPFNGTEYVETAIGDLATGLTKVQFSGRVVNWRDVFGKSKRESSARGWHIMLVHGERGVISVRIIVSALQICVQTNKIYLSRCGCISANSPTCSVLASW